MVRKIIQIGDERLLQKSLPINTNVNELKDVKNLAQDLLDTCKHYIKEAAGLSAVQLGILKRIFIIRRLDLEEQGRGKKRVTKAKWEIVINPELAILDEKKSFEWEGCMSINIDGKRLYGPVARPKRIKLNYYDLNGKSKELIAEDFFAHLIQHEMDHLNGILFLSHIADPRNLWNEAQLDKYIEDNNSMPPIYRSK